MRSLQAHQAQRPGAHRARGHAGARSTLAAEHLREFLATLDAPVLGYLRDTHNYVHLAARGMTLWDVAPGRVERDLEQWQPILRFAPLKKASR